MDLPLWKGLHSETDEAPGCCWACGTGLLFEWHCIFRDSCLFTAEMLSRVSVMMINRKVLIIYLVQPTACQKYWIMLSSCLNSFSGLWWQVQWNSLAWSWTPSWPSLPSSAQSPLLALTLHTSSFTHSFRRLRISSPHHMPVSGMKFSSYLGIFHCCSLQNEKNLMSLILTHQEQPETFGWRLPLWSLSLLSLLDTSSSLSRIYFSKPPFFLLLIPKISPKWDAISIIRFSASSIFSNCC